jgi:hypothetical protein
MNIAIAIVLAWYLGDYITYIQNELTSKWDGKVQ